MAKPAVPVDLAGGNGNAAVDVSDHTEDCRIIAERLCDSLSRLGVRLVVGGDCNDFGARDATRIVAFIDGEFHRLFHLDTETSRSRGQRPANTEHGNLQIAFRLLRLSCTV